MGIRVRVIAAVMAVGTLTAVVTPAVAAAVPVGSAAEKKAGPKDGPKDGQDDKAKPKGGKENREKDEFLAKVAASLHVSVKQLVTALDHLKQALGKGVSEEEALKAFAKELKITLTQAKEALKQLSAKDKPGVPAEAVKLLAAELHISADRASKVFNDLDKVRKTPGDIVKNPDFIAIANGLGITPERLLAALIKVKQEVAEKPTK
jgi:regulator of replication initiation timing